MKTILENGDVILNHDTRVILKKDLKDGDITDHKGNVYNIEMYYNHHHNNYVRVFLDKKMILELAEKIKTIEENVTMEAYFCNNNLPF